MKHLKRFEQKNIKELDLTYKDLTELPELPDTLKTLFCFDNKLTELPELPDTLKTLICYNNKLTELPELPDTLEYLYCSNNNLPYNDLDGYWDWYENVKHPEIGTSKKYNI